MRRFVILGHTQKADAPISLDDPVAAGRWDVLTRSVGAALLLSNGIRHDTEVFIILLASKPVRTIWIKSDEVRNLGPDDRSILGLLSKALTVRLVGAHPMDSTAGIYAAGWDLGAVLDRCGKEGPLVLLHEMGLLLEHAADIRDVAEGTFILSDHQDFSPAQLAEIRGRARHVYSLGPLSLHTSNCIAILHNLIDRTGTTAPAAH